MENDIESHSLLTIDVLRFDGDRGKWPEFIDNINARVHIIVTFNDSMRIEKSKSILNGDSKKAVLIGSNIIFYAAALKTLK